MKPAFTQLVKYISIKDAARLLGCRQDTIEHHISTGYLKVNDNGEVITKTLSDFWIKIGLDPQRFERILYENSTHGH